MKKSILIMMAALVLLATGACSSFSNRGEVVDPMIGSANTRWLSVEKVSLTDSSTVLDFVVHFTPNYWVQVAESSAIVADGVAYPVTEFIGISADEQVYMPDSGIIRFSAIFPAIPAGVKAIDFTEGMDDGWQLWDIDVTGTADHNYNVSKVPAKVIKADAKTDMPEVRITAGDTTTLNIHILGYRPEMGNKLYWVINSPTGQEGADSPLDIDAEGNATLVRVLAVPSTFIPIGFSQENNLNGRCILSPGETADLYLDSHTTGLANMNTRAYPQTYARPEGYQPAYFAGRYPGPMQTGRRNTMHLYSGKFVDYHMSADEYTEYIIDRYNEVKADMQSDSLGEPLVDFKLALLNGDLIALAADPRQFLSRNYYYTHGGWGGRIPTDTIIESLSPDNLRRIASMVDFNDANLLLNDEIPYFSLNYEIWENPGILKTVNLYNKAYSAAEGVKLDTAAIAELRLLSEPLADAAEAHYIAKRAEMDALDDSLMTPTPDVANDKLFEAIIAPHKGKVVMVDLWNTWCGPCRAALAANEPEKSGDLSSDDIVWIYIADESSPLPTYLKMIKDIRGIHYRLTEEQKNALREQFGVDGIPYYILVDRNGKYAGRPDLRDHSAFKKAILSEL